MATSVDAHTTTPDKTFQTSTDLASRVNQNGDKTPEIIAGLSDTDLRVGFTIPDLDKLLPADRSVDNLSKSVIGWIFLFPNYSEKKGDSHLIADIAIEELLIQEDTSGQIEVVKQPLVHTISPKIFGSKRGITPVSLPITYADAYDQLSPFYLNDLLLHISRMDGYETWAELAFISRTDLDLMRIMLEDPVSPYNEFFFSGAKSDYLAMHNPEYLMRSENFKGRFTGQMVTPTTNRAFTLKCEPIITQNDKIVKAISGATGTNLSGSGVGSLPVIALMAPCPELWYYENAMEKTLKSEEQRLGTGARAVIRRILTSPAASQQGNFRQSIPGSTYPLPPYPPALIPLGRPDCFDRLRNVWTAISRLFTGRRASHNRKVRRK